MAAEKRTSLITGCSEGGLGEEMAKQYHALGLPVFATARNPASMAALQALGIDTIALDVTKPESITSVKAEIERLTGGKLNILINNAGTSYPFAAADISMDTVRKLYEVNVFAVMAMVKESITFLFASGDGCIVNIGSLSGVVPMPFGLVYGFSKAALHAYNDVIRVELAPFGVRVLLVVSRNVKTHITKTSWKMPADSIYLPIENEFRYNRREHLHDGAHERTPVVAQIVAESLKQAPRAWLWVALNSSLVWFDSFVSKKFGMTKLASILQAENKTST